MSAIVDVTVNNVTYDAQMEYTHPQVAQAFVALLNPFFEVASGTETPANRSAQMADNLEALLLLVRDGSAALPQPLNPPVTKTQFLTVEMVRDLNVLIQSLKVANIVIPTIPSSGSIPNITISDTQAAIWASIAVQTSVSIVLNRAFDVSTAGNRTLQALLELEYIRVGSEVMVNSLGSLEEALKATKEALDVLNDIQALHNKLDVTKRGDFKDFTFTTNDAIFDQLDNDNLLPSVITFNYELATLGVNTSEPDGHFRPLVPIHSADLNNLIALKNRLESAITKVSATGAASGQGTLLGSLQAVKDDLANVTNGATLAAWVLDGLDDVENNSQVGEIQDRITTAITAGQSLNDTQKENVRRVLFVFEEYYKSAAALLIKITQLIEKIAQGIAR